MLQEENKAGTHLKVGSLEVLQDFTGAGVQRIINRIDQTAQSVSTLAGEVDRSYREAVSDNKITPTEKKQLKKQWNEIQQTYAAILATAETKHLSTDPIIIAYSNAYNELIAYLSLIDLFGDMSSTTEIASAEEMETHYNDYFSLQTYAQAIINGTKELNSLDDPGEEGQSAWYKNVLYVYRNGTWVKANTESYLGIYNEYQSPQNDGSYFLAGTNFSDVLINTIKAEGKTLTANGKKIAVRRTYKRGYIYLTDNGLWKTISDKNDWRYIVSLLDLSNVGVEPPPALTGIVSNSVDYAYLSIAYTMPTVARPGNYVVWGSHDTDLYKKGAIYKYNGEIWEYQDPKKSSSYSMYMTALTDIAKTTDSEDANFFTEIYANTIIANQAVIKSLFTQKIVLSKTGTFESEEFSVKTGFRLGGSGDFSCRNGTFHGDLDCGKLIISHNYTIPIPDKSWHLPYYHEIADFLWDYGARRSDISCTGTYGLAPLVNIGIRNYEHTHYVKYWTYRKLSQINPNFIYTQPLPSDYDYQDYIETYDSWKGTLYINGAAFTINDEYRTVEKIGDWYSGAAHYSLCTLEKTTVYTPGSAARSVLPIDPSPTPSVPDIYFVYNYVAENLPELKQPIDTRHRFNVDVSIDADAVQWTMQFVDIPTSLESWMPVGTVWNDNGTLKIKQS